MRPKSIQNFIKMVDKFALPKVYTDFLHEYIYDIPNIEKDTSRTKFWHLLLTILTTFGGATISALRSQEFSGDPVFIIHWFLFGLGLIVTFCGLLETTFSLSKTKKDYETIAQDMRATCLKELFLEERDSR